MISLPEIYKKQWFHWLFSQSLINNYDNKDGGCAKPERSMARVCLVEEIENVQEQVFEDRLRDGL